MNSPAGADTPARVSKLGYVGFETQDVDRLVDHYTRLLDFVLVERTNDEAFLTTNFEHHEIVLRKSESPRARTVVGYQVDGEIDDAQRRLKDAGLAVERRSDIAPATPDVLVLEEPGSGVPIHLYDQQSGSGVTGYTPLRPSKLGHVATFTPSLQDIQGFYQGLLGFKWSDTIEDFFVFMRCNSDHHAANFIKSDKDSGMHHVAFEMRDLNHLQTMLDYLASHRRQLDWGPGRHGPGHNIFTYHTDPDGNTIELFTQLDVIVDEAKGYFEPRPWHNDFPQYPKTWEVDIMVANSWGPVRPGVVDH
jgi:catechol-2,3-dioxygenase